MGRKPNDADSFWSKVAKGAPTDCWLWTASRFRDGYGQFKYLGRNRRTHQLAYEIANGVILPAPIPLTVSSPCVCHSCDNRLCCNPAHLWIGTIGDNIRDAAAKGRLAVPKNRARGAAHGSHRRLKSSYTRGSAHGTARLVEAAVVQIRAHHAAGMPIARIAPKFGVSESAIRKIVRRQTWAHLP